MSVTAPIKPTGYQPIHNDLQVLLYEFFTTIPPKYQYCLDVTISDVNIPYSRYIGRFKSRPVQNIEQEVYYGFFNLSDILQNAQEFSTWPLGFKQKQAWKIDVIAGREQATSTSAAPVYTSGTSFSFVGYNGALPISEFQSYNSADLINTTTLVATSGVALKFLTSLPNRKIVNSSELNLDFLNNTVRSRYLVKFFNGNIQLGTTSGEAGTDLVTGVDDGTYKRINFSPSQFTIPSGTTRYTVELIRQSNTNPLTQPYEVLLNSECTRFEAVNVYFQNKYGAEDVYVFNRKSTKQSNIQRKNFERGFGLNTPYSIQGTNTYASNIRRQHTLNSDWLTQAESEALSELVESNNVYIAFAGNYIPGRKSQIDFTFTNIPILDGDYFINLNWFFQFINNAGTFNFTMDDLQYFGTPVEVGDFLCGLISTTVPFNIFYDVTNLSTNSPAVVKFRLTAKQNGTIYNFTNLTTSPVSAGTAYGTFNNNILGINDDIPQRIPVTVNNDSFEYRKKINGDLIQVELTVTEKASYERQVK